MTWPIRLFTVIPPLDVSTMKRRAWNCFQTFNALDIFGIFCEDVRSQRLLVTFDVLQGLVEVAHSKNGKNRSEDLESCLDNLEQLRPRAGYHQPSRR